MDKPLILGLIKIIEGGIKELKEATNNDNITRMSNMLYSIKVTTQEIDDIMKGFL